MNHFFSAALICILTIPALADDAKTNTPAAPKKSDNSSALTLPASAAIVTAPLILTNGFLCLNGDKAEVADGGKAVFNFAVTNAGDYVIEASVNAPGEDSNSFFLNVDDAPTDPLAIWDIDPTTDFEKRIVSWRGDGSDTSDQFAPKHFKLSAGKHKLIVIGREPETELKSLTLRVAPPE
ncbi:MAG: hypothetical protein ACRD4P_16770 [Bryobacteraceae bacterium]